MTTDQLVDPTQFLRATREAGYRSTASALAELVDNAVQAGARRIAIDISRGDTGEPSVEVRDDGQGMTRREMALCLRFGGSARFDDRTSLGRFGMGLPNASMSQARRVDVTSWRGSRAFTAYLDLDECLQGGDARGLAPRPVTKRDLPGSASGTIVRWEKCDRLDRRQMAALERRVKQELGQTYRYYLAGGLSIELNGSQIGPVDPLLSLAAPRPGSAPFGERLVYEVATASGLATVTVRFVELPVRQWHALADAEKRRLGIAGGAGVSVLRHQREIDFGWFFMGSKRRENYDDWWRAEIEFPASLDEAFGVTNLKQGIRPQLQLIDLLAPDVEAMARALNARARNRFDTLKLEASSEPACAQAERAEKLLDVPHQSTAPGRSRRYQLRVAPLRTSQPLRFRIRPTTITVEVNEKHPFFRDIYRPLLTGSPAGDHASVRQAFEVALLALGRAADRLARDSVLPLDGSEHCLDVLGDTLATFLNCS